MRDNRLKILFVSLLGLFILIFIMIGVLLKKQKKPATPVKSPETNLKSVKKTGVNAAFLQDGKIWFLNQQGDKKTLFIDAKKGSVVDFVFSPDYDFLFYLTDKGELWKRKKSGETSNLVSETADMTPSHQAPIGDSQPFDYMKGKVLSFHLSPDGNYIAYKTLESYTATGHTIIVGVTSFRVMDKDGAKKTLISKPAEISRQLTWFDGWFPESKNILLHYAAPDEPTQGSYFYQASVDGKDIKKYTSITYSSYLPDTVTVAGAVPAFSPDNLKLAFIEGGFNGEGKVWFSGMDGSERKLLIEQGLQNGKLKWSDNGSYLLLYDDSKIYEFSNTGQQTRSFEVTDAQDLQVIYPPQEVSEGMSNENYIGRFIAGGYKNKKDKKLTVFRIDKTNYEKIEKSVDYPFDFDQARLVPQFFSKDGAFVYLIIQHTAKNFKALAKPVLQLWLFDPKTDSNYKLMDDVVKVVPLDSYNVGTF